MKKKEIKYQRDLPRLMYSFFLNYQESGIPSTDKFARSIGTTNSRLEGFRIHKTFDKAWRECNEIRRDYLIDGALTRRFDPSFVKFLLSEEKESDIRPEENLLEVNISVVGENKSQKASDGESDET